MMHSNNPITAKGQVQLIEDQAPGTVDRRRLMQLSILGAAGAAPLSASVAAPVGEGLDGPQASIHLNRYVQAGGKASGGPGELAVGSWMKADLEGLGFKVHAQPFTAPYFDLAGAQLTAGGLAARVLPHAIVVPTLPDGVTGPLAVRSIWTAADSVQGAIVILQLPYARWSTAATEAVTTPVRAAFQGGAEAVLLVTNGPTGGAIALNADGLKPMFSGPVAILAPEAAVPFFKLPTGATARLKIVGSGGRRDTFNLIGRLDLGLPHWLVVSTPRSGWFTCAGERGGGVAVWMMLAGWATRAKLPVNLAFVATSGHEYENLGAHELFSGAVPPPDQTRLWFHLGANVAARDWHELGKRLAPLPGADSQRVLMVSEPLLDTARTAFAGLVGLEAPTRLEAGAPGELGEYSAAGYGSVAGVFGAHRFHHAQDDDQRCVDANLVASVAQASARFLSAALA